MNIGSRNSYPSRQLSNFALSPFIIDNIQCNSMEGFIQALKFKDENIQKEVCKLIGREAKFRGKYKKWWKRPEKEQLWWLGKSFACHSDKHLKLIKRALIAKFTQHNSSYRALMSTGDTPLTHSIGKNDKTSLKANDFCRLLIDIRKELKNGKI